MSNEVTVQKPAYIANLNPLEADFQPDIADIKVPNIILAQPASDVLKEENDGYIDGLKAGQFYNSSTRQVYGKILHLIYVHHFKVFPVYKMNGQIREYQETLSQAQFDALKGKCRPQDGYGTMSVDKPDCIIGEHWKFVVINADDASFDFMFLTIKEGGLSDARMWYNKIFSAWKGNPTAGIEGKHPFTVVWELNPYLKESKTSSSTSYQLNGNGIKEIGWATEEQYNRAIKTKDSINSIQHETTAGGEY